MICEWILDKYAASGVYAECENQRNLSLNGTGICALNFDCDCSGRCRFKIETAKCAEWQNIAERAYEKYTKWIFDRVHRANLEKEPSDGVRSVLCGHKTQSKGTGNMYLNL